MTAHIEHQGVVLERLAHLKLLQKDDLTEDPKELRNCPIFTEAVRVHALSLPSQPFSQYGLLGGDCVKMPNAISAEDPMPSKNDPRLFQNISAPSSVFICGSQGSGKSHTLSCMLENCLAVSDANTLPRPLTGVVFHYDCFTSDTSGTPCEAAYLSSHRGIKVRVLCAPTNIVQIRRLYDKVPNVTVEELRFDEADLNTKRMLDMMAAGSVQGGSMPLYLHVVTRILRQLRITQQQHTSKFNYLAFKKALEAEDLTPGQRGPLQQRLDTLESFLVSGQVSKLPVSGKKKQMVVSAKRGTDWAPKVRRSPVESTVVLAETSQAGQLTVVDLSCPCVTAEAACALFNICLSLFLEQSSTIGRVVALDEAHKYMTDTADCERLTQALLTTIRLQRHQGARVIVSTQEPTISTKLLDLCSITIVHRFTSPDWLRALRAHLAGATSLNRSDGTVESDQDAQMDLFSQILALRTGEALLFAPSAVIGIRQLLGASMDGSLRKTETEGGRPRTLTDSDGESVKLKTEVLRLGHSFIKLVVRQRITRDGGRSVMAS
ncbi:hypothetical protein PCL_08334 [Purpureocillium lilacinum]|uniref:P-loop containing nucleoside triphosphate hydrolase n=1 Tax=Purpureocillium lilacinum TaxID=33203 RepID=A0A2U3DRW8_PURLI|nr:hypothetical protein PCL_08334 [Purpureocillium lilacinum]